MEQSAPHDTFLVRSLGADDIPACEQIVASLPYHFADPEGLRQCHQALREQPGLVAEVAGQVVGFLTITRPFPASAEITWLAVHVQSRRQGVGAALVDAAADQLRNEGRRLLLAATLAEGSAVNDPPDGYTATRAFYHAHGFLDTWLPQGYWSENQQALLLVKVLREE